MVHIANYGLPRKLSAEHLAKQIQEAQAELAKNPANAQSMLILGMAQYRQLLGIRGDNTPSKALYLNYLDATELYPEIRVTPLEDYIRDAFASQVRAPRRR